MRMTVPMTQKGNYRKNSREGSKRKPEERVNIDFKKTEYMAVG